MSVNSEPIITIANARKSIEADKTGQLQLIQNEEGGVFFARYYGGHRYEIFARVVEEDRKGMNLSLQSGTVRQPARPLCIDLFCGLGGWADGFLAEGYDVIGFDIERHDYGTGGYPGQLVLQDVLTLDGRQFRNAAVIVASPPCQAYSYRAMPWKRAKALPPPDNTLFEACFRIAREASWTCRDCDGTGMTRSCCRCERCDGKGFRQVPLIVENVRGAQKWVGRARWNVGSLYLWGDVPALMPNVKAIKRGGFSWSDYGKPGYVPTAFNGGVGVKVPSFRCDGSGRSFQTASVRRTDPDSPNGMPMMSSKSPARKAASAQIAKIPFPLAQWIAKTFKP